MRRGPQALRPPQPPSSEQRLRDDSELARCGEPRLLAEHVEAAGLDPVERLAVQARERADAERATAVERLEQAQPFDETRPSALGLKGHQLSKLRRRRKLLHPERNKLVLRQVDPPELLVLVHVADDVDQL